LIKEVNIVNNNILLKTITHASWFSVRVNPTLWGNDEMRKDEENSLKNLKCRKFSMMGMFRGLYRLYKMSM